MKKKGRRCALCGRLGGCTFLSLLMRWDVFNAAEGRTNQFAHPECIHKEQQKRKAARAAERTHTDDK